MNEIYKKNIYSIIKLALLLIAVLYNNYSFAIGLGDIKVYSYLNEPLNAEIILTGVEELDTNNIIAELASSNDFMRTGIPRPVFLTKLKFETIRTSEATVIYISTTQAVKHPFLDFLVQLVWPDGKIIKSYTILLDPKTDNHTNSHTKSDSPISRKILNTPLEKDQQLNSNITSDAIFATSLEESIENEAILKNKGKKNIAKNVVVPENLAMFSTTEPDEADNNHTRHQDSALAKVISSLHAFSEHSNRPKINYEKLLDLKPTSVTVNKHAEKLAENMAISQINSELDSLRNRNSEKLYYVNSEEQLSKESLVTNSYLELIKKYGNDLLWACFLVSTTVFLFYKMMFSHQHAAAASLVPIVEPPPSPQSHEYHHHQNIDNILADLTVEQAIPTTITAYNEELELKIALSKQYIAAGDKKSAKDILQDITIVKEQKYQDQISALLKSII